MEIKTFVVSIPRSQIEKAYEWLKDEDFDGFSSAYIAQDMVNEGIRHYFHSKGIFDYMHIEGIDFKSDLEGFDGALALVRKLPKNIVFKANCVTGGILDGLYLSMVNFKDEASDLFSTLNLDPNRNKGMLHIYPDQLIKGLKEAKNKDKQTFIQWLTICLKCLYPNVDFIPASEGDLITKGDMLKTLKMAHTLHITLKKGVAGHWIVEGI